MVEVVKFEPKSRVNAELVERLKELLKRAESGEIIGIAYVCMLQPDSPNEIIDGWVGLEDTYKLVGFLDNLQFSLNYEATVRSRDADPPKEPT